MEMEKSNSMFLIAIIIITTPCTDQLIIVHPESSEPYLEEDFYASCLYSVKINLYISLLNVVTPEVNII